jgi:hypothetical protein
MMRKKVLTMQHYRRLAEEAAAEAAAEAMVPMSVEQVAYAAATGCTCHECRSEVDRSAMASPVTVPDLYTDVWGEAR